MSRNAPVTAVVEKLVIPTYVPPPAEELPMYSEFRQHQGSTGYAYPNRVTTRTEREVLTDREYEVIRLENDYIRLLVLPELGGRVLEGFDKTTNYHFLYRHNRIKPVLVGTYGSWISGGLEFNFPHHHRPSTYMPVDYEIEVLADGTAICWLSECAPSSGQFRIRGTVGIVLTPDASYFETKVHIVNRTEVEHPFMWWENAGIHVNEDYQVFFPQDVTYAHHHYDRHHATWPLMQGWYAVEEHVDVTDISFHKNTIKGNSYFAGPSKYDFFGGYDHQRECGIVHVGDHHVSPGKKNFQWGLEALGDAWNAKLTDIDGEHAELMAGSFSDDQPDFTWLAPYETKRFSQFWYPIPAINAPTFANLYAAVNVDRPASKIRLAATKRVDGGRLVVRDGQRIALDERVSLAPSQPLVLDAELSDERYTVEFYDGAGSTIFSYTEIRPDRIDLPRDNATGIPTPHQLATAQQISIAGRHIDQYRDPSWTGDEYYQVALERDPEFLPALLGRAQHSLANLKFDEALRFLHKAEKAQNAFNPNPSDGTLSYLIGLALLGLHRLDEAYDALYKASWSANVIPAAMSVIAGIDGRRGDYTRMLHHASFALEKEAHHPIAGVYAALACWRLGDTTEATSRLERILEVDRLNHLARYARILVTGQVAAEFFSPSQIYSNASQTVLDVVFDLSAAGLVREGAELLSALEDERGASASALYVLADIQEQLGNNAQAAAVRAQATQRRSFEVFPYLPGELAALESAVAAHPDDATAQYLLGCILYDKKYYERAARAWEAAIQHDASFYPSYRNLAVAYYSKLSRAEESLVLLLRALELKPRDDLLLKEIAYVSARQGVDSKERLALLLGNLPEKPSDNLTLDLANAYIAAGEYSEAVRVLEAHQFVPAECTETYLTEAYTLANVNLGRLALGDGDLEGALDLFRRAQTEPDGFDAGWWDTQALYSARYFEAVVLDRLGRAVERDAVIKQITTYVISNYSPYMPPERFYYIAAAMRLGGDDLGARALMTAKGKEWAQEIDSDVDRKLVQTALFISYVDDPKRVHRAAMLAALGFERLFFGDQAAAREFFEQSLALDPDNLRVRFELGREED